MPRTVTAWQGETVDALVWRVTGSSALTDAVFAANPGLADLGLFLPMGTPVVIPDAPATVTLPRTTLWD
ncbi:tail protein X [Novispirillum itersonii]|uniref:tail protein X n=1 Tax=Novispirillum itersonii TaxID=189 RepID=UPI0003702503|nr:tail protein X [Novispirillum itersonii]